MAVGIENKGHIGIPGSRERAIKVAGKVGRNTGGLQ